MLAAIDFGTDAVKISGERLGAGRRRGARQNQNISLDGEGSTPALIPGIRRRKAALGTNAHRFEWKDHTDLRSIEKNAGTDGTFPNVLVRKNPEELPILLAAKRLTFGN